MTCYRTKKFLLGLCVALPLLYGGCAAHSPKLLERETTAVWESSVSWTVETPKDEEKSGERGSVGEKETADKNETASDWERHIAWENVVIPGVEGAYDILFLTDCHVVIMDERDDAQVAESAPARYAEFQNAEGISAAEQFADWIDYANEQGVDAVLLGGDIIDYPTEGCLAYLEEQLGRLEMPYLYTMGNHDWTFPWEYMTEKGRETYLPLLEPYTAGDPLFQTWETKDFAIIAVDDSPGQVNAEALRQYKEFTKTEKPMIVLVHVPFLTQSVLTQAREVWDSSVVIGGGNYGGIYPDKVSEEFVDLITAEESLVELVLAGHVHFYDRDYLEGEKNVLQLVGDAGYHGSAMMIHISGQEE